MKTWVTFPPTLAPTYQHAATIINQALDSAQVDPIVLNELQELKDDKRPIYLLAIGKAAWSMAAVAVAELGTRLHQGIVITKYGHSQGELDRCCIYEAGHPVLDDNSLTATRRALTMVDALGAGDLLLFLVSGGGSALFELPLLSLSELQSINAALLASGADIVAINTIRKRLSAVKGGRLALRALPAQIFTIVLSDIIGDPLDSIASGPAYPDPSTTAAALALVEKYKLPLSPQALQHLSSETPKELSNVRSRVGGNVALLCHSAASTARSLGYTPLILSDRLDCEAREAGRFIASMALTQQQMLHETKATAPLALIMGGETVVTLRGKGKGGRNQELALAAVPGLANCPGAVLFSLGSDGSDGPTDAAGAIVSSSSLAQLKQQGLSVSQLLAHNDSYSGLKAIQALLYTGPTGTNINDLTVLLLPLQNN